MFKVKVCGITSENIAPVLNKAHPDYVGFILSQGFGRSISKDTAKKIRGILSPDIQTVGVFVNEDINCIVDFYESGVINLIQLHGDENYEYIEKLKTRCPLKVIKAVGVNDGNAGNYPENCDMVLLDACDKKARGGTGKKIEWRRYDEIKKPFFLAGGITPDNVEEALKAVMPYGIDTSGGVETDGAKDAEKIENYINKVRNFKSQRGK